MINRILFVLLLSFVVWSCGNTHTPISVEIDEESKDQISVPDTVIQEKDPFDYFIAHFNTDTTLFADTLLEIAQHGAIPSINIISRLEVISVLSQMDYSNVLRESLPKVDCDNESLYNKQGNYFSKGNNIVALVDMILETEKKPISSVVNLKTIDHTFIDTKQHIKLYFRLEGPELILVAIDRIVPCSA